MKTPRDVLTSAFQAALDAANPHWLVPPHLPSPPKGRTLVVGGGKAAAAMAVAVEAHWPMDAPLSGLVVTRYQHGLPTRRIEVVEASHPLPDDRGAIAASRMQNAIRELSADDLLLVLLSGGGSSLLALPVEGVSLADLRTVTKSLLTCGAPIQEINTVRKHLTQFSGGRVAALSSAPVVALIISDVVGDDPANIASGPCAPDPGTFADAAAILHAHKITPPQAIGNHFQLGLDGLLADTPKSGDPIFRHVENRIIGNARRSLAAAVSTLASQSIQVMNLGEVEGEASVLAQSHAQFIHQHLLNVPRPFALLSGGEAAVTLTHPHGRGGRNTEYLLALGLALQNAENIWALACDTDGQDGTEENGGALWTPDTIKLASSRKLDAENHLQRHDAYGFFQAVDGLITTGPTLTNVNDFRLVLVP